MSRLIEKDVPANYYAPDGYRYGVMFSDGSVAAYWNGRTQRERAEEYRDTVLADQRERLAGTERKPDNVTLARRALGQSWTRVIPPESDER